LGYLIIARSSAGGHPMLVFDHENRLHLPLTVFATEAVKRSSSSTARIYVNAIAPFFAWLDRNEWQGRSHRLWNEASETIRRAIGDYLVERLNCKVRDHHAGFQLVSRTGGTRTTVRVFLSALKLFYRIMRAQDRYSYANPLVDGPSAVLAEIQERMTADHDLPRIPQISGVVLPPKRRLSDSYFKLVGESWVPQVIDDLEFPAQIQAGGRRIGWSLREQCIVRILFESGCRVSEVVGLSLADWAARGLLQETQAFSKGSHGRRVKFIRFSPSTAKLLRRYFDTERRDIDGCHLGLDSYVRQAEDNRADMHNVPLFLSRRGAQLTPKAFREGFWNLACRAAGIEADVHQARHWYVTQAIRGIYETSRSESDIQRRLRELIEYMGWKSGWETLEAYQHYFDPLRHAEIQDRLHQRLDETLQHELAHRPPEGHPVPGALNCSEAEDGAPNDELDPDFEYLLVLGGKRANDNRE
jgi:integrase